MRAAVDVLDARRVQRTGVGSNGYVSVRRTSGISGRSSVARLASVDEADEEELADREVWSPRSNASSAFEFASDDDLENRMAQPTARKEKLASYEGKSPRRHSRSLRRASAIAQASADMTMTLDEHKHKKLVALFYWRRRALEKHYTAWKRVVLERRRRQRSELELLRPYAPSLVRRPERVLPPRRHSTLQRSGPSIREEVPSGTYVDERPGTVDRIRSLREEYRRLKATERADEQPQAQPVVTPPALSPKPRSPVKRVQLSEPTFREKLPMYYRVFEAWQEFVEQLHEERMAREKEAAVHYDNRRLTRCFRVWASQYIAIRRGKHAAWRRACSAGDRATKRRRLHTWAGAVSQQRILDERVERMQRWHIMKVLVRWRRRASEGVIRRCVEAMAKRHVLKRRLKMWRKFVAYRQLRKRRSQSAVAHYRGSLVKACWGQWAFNSVKNECALLLDQRSRTVQQTLAVRKWKLYVERRRMNQDQMLEADCWQYTGLLRRSWTRWGLYVNQRRERSYDLDQALQHYISHCKRRAIRLLLTHRCCRLYLRGQCRGASDFFRQKRIRAVLRVWQKSVRDRQKWISFRCNRVKRCVVICFVALKHHARRTLRLRTAADLLSVRTRGKNLRDVFQCWLYIQRIRIAEKVVCSRREAVMLHDILGAWKVYSGRRRKQRRALNEAIDRRSRLSNHTVLRQWFSVVMSKRCRQRLVRLFQKKHGRKRLHVYFFELHRQAKLRNLQVRNEKRILNEYWCMWVSVTREREHQHASMTAATQYYEAKRFSRAISLWKMNARRWIMRRRNDQKAIRLLVQRTMKRVLHRWYLHARGASRRRELIERRASIRVSRLQRRCFKTWYAMARRLAKRRVDFHRLWSGVMLRRRQRAFYAWCEFRQRRIERRNVVLDSRWRQTLRTARVVMQQWRLAAFRCKRRRLKHREIIRRVRWRILFRVFNVWYTTTNAQRRIREDMRKAIAFHREYVLLTSFCGWLHATLELQVTREKRERTASALMRKRMRRTVRLWRGRMCVLRLQTNLHTKADLWYEKRQREKGVTLWKAFREAATKRNEASARATAHRNHNLLHSSFHRWILFTSDTRAFKRKLRSVFQTGEDDVRRKVMRCWKRYKRTPTLLKRAQGWRRYKFLNKIFGLWKGQVAFAQKMKSNVLITHQLLLTSALTTAFSCWTQYTVSRRKKQHAMRVGEDHFRHHSYRLAIQRLRIHIRHARAVELSTTYHADHLLLHYFNQWKSGIVMQRRRRELKACVLLKYRRHQLKTAFGGWRRLVTAIQNALQAKASAFLNGLIVKHIWKAWNRVVTCRRLICLNAVKQERALRTNSFRQWCIFVCDQQQIRRHVEAAVAHVDRVVILKIWHQWIRFVQIRRERNRLEAKAMAFYAVHVLGRRSFHAWCTFVDMRSVKVGNRIRADAFCAMKAMGGAFEHLVAYVLHRKQREEAKQTEDERIADHLVRSAVQKWHFRSLSLHKLRRNQSEAIQFFRQRRLARCVSTMIENAAKRKELRTLLDRARMLLVQRSVSRCWAKWCAFCQWRRRHKHLLRLFRTNQLCDYFAFWRNFVSHRMLKRALHVRAHKGYRMITQARLFKYWKSRCSYWKAKRHADKWRTERACSHVVNVWARRVRVLSKMRRMLQSQDSVRLEVHFVAWKRRWWYKQLQIRRVGDARIWFCRLQQAKCFALWVKWLEIRRQEKRTVTMAVGFSRRFNSRKYFQAWCRDTNWRRRKQVLTMEAESHFERRLRQRALSRLRLYAERKQQLKEIVRDATLAFEARHVERAVHHWNQLHHVRAEMRKSQQRANTHCANRLKEKTWHMLNEWLMRCRLRRAKMQQADEHRTVVMLKKVLRMWASYLCRLRGLRNSLQHFKARYFRNVADVCFYEWQTLVDFRKRLRRLRETSRRSERRRVLQAWYCFTTQKRDLLTRVSTLQTRQENRLLRLYVEHWEECTTDTWMYRQLAAAGQKRYNRKCVARAVMQWKNMHARCKWREKARRRHADSLRGLLRYWNDVSRRDIETGTHSE